MEHWIIPCNVSVYNVIDHFKRRKTIIWKNAFTIKKGDIAYLYLSLPYARIKYKCLVINDAIPDDILLANSYAIPTKKVNNFYSKKEKYIELKLLEELDDYGLTYSELKEHGLGQVQIQARVNRHLLPYLQQFERKGD